MACGRRLGRSPVWEHAQTLIPLFFFSKTNCDRTTTSTNCDTSVNSNEGCGVSFTNSGPNYGTQFNLNGGGYWVMSKSQSSGIQVWFWPRNSPDIPPEICEGAEVLTPNPTWGAPAANFPMYPNYCDYNSHFNAHIIVFDLTLCVSALFYSPSTFSLFPRAQLRRFPFAQGDWAGAVWPTSGCGIDTCEDCKHQLAYDGQCRIHQLTHFRQMSTITRPPLARPTGRSIACVYTPFSSVDDPLLFWTLAAAEWIYNVSPFALCFLALALVHVTRYYLVCLIGFPFSGRQIFFCGGPW